MLIIDKPVHSQCLLKLGGVQPFFLCLGRCLKKNDPAPKAINNFVIVKTCKINPDIHHFKHSGASISILESAF